MEEDEFRATRESVRDLVCPFEKAILTRRFRCSRSCRIFLAEREVAGCQSPTAQHNCVTLKNLLRDNVRFVLHERDVSATLTHGKDMKVQCGGLLGLQRLLLAGRSGATEVDDVHDVVERAQDRYGTLEALPFAQLMPAIQAFELRRRRSR